MATLTSEDSFVCSICLQFESEITPDWFVTTPNGHIFHFNKCIKIWLAQSTSIDPNRRESQSTSSNSGIPDGNSNEFQNLTLDDSSASNRIPDFTFKIILLGGGGVGKSSLLQRYATGVFNYSITSTIGFEVSFKMIDIGGKLVKLSIWDTGGQDVFRSVSQNFVRNAHGILLVYSYGELEKDSLNDMQYWINFADKHGIPGAAMLVVGNKVDIPESQRTITTEMGENFARSRGLTFFETSARDHHNVDAVFRTLAIETLQRVESKQMEYKSPEEERSFRLRLYEEQQQQSRNQQSSNRKKSCC